ncbi:MAG: hypothetical protein ABF537_15170 [Acetobacter sp.]|uniref:hypothetical protein n=1 Tax=Acetobacter TaxID=434 RepID=UPI000B304048|nr:hypothetical protein [Acetobacter malorum]
MNDNQTTGSRLRAWLSETKIYSNGATFSRKEIIIYSASCLAALPVIVTSGFIVDEWAIRGLTGQSTILTAVHAIKLTLIGLIG